MIHLSKHLYNFDDSLRNFVELKQGGKEEFQEIIDNDVYSPYNWMVPIKKARLLKRCFNLSLMEV